jgi:mono/diheme cytochrome c family protein
MVILVTAATGLVLLTACGSAGGKGADSANDTAGFAALPAGNAAAGETLFIESINGAPTCVSCHALDDRQLIGPGVQGYAAVAGTRVAGQSAGEYTYLSIVQPAAHLVSGYGNIMYPLYGQRLTNTQIADLIAYLLTL